MNIERAIWWPHRKHSQRACVNTSLDRASHCPERNHRKSNVKNDVPVTSSLTSLQSVLRPYISSLLDPRSVQTRAVWAQYGYNRRSHWSRSKVCVTHNAFAGCWVQFVQSSQGLYRACHPTARVKPSEDEWSRAEPIIAARFQLIVTISRFPLCNKIHIE